MQRNNLITVVAFFWIGMIAVLIFADAAHRPVSAMSQNRPAKASTAPIPASPPEPPVPQADPAVVEADVEVPDPSAPLDPLDPNLLIAPYNSYTVTQESHGFSYGHAAIDLTAGEGAEIGSPINGTVTQFFYDELGNPTLIIENERYQVTLMHGEYRVNQGDTVTAGQVVGSESNLGNTVDWWGRSCRGRDCGYHTHLNVYDKHIGQNVNPLRLFSPAG